MLTSLLFQPQILVPKSSISNPPIVLPIICCRRIKRTAQQAVYPVQILQQAENFPVRPLTFKSLSAFRIII